MSDAPEGDDRLDAEDRRTLLRIARETISARAGRRAPARIRAGRPALETRCGAFVSIHKKGSLRGCIGTFTAEGPLHSTIEEMAESASAKDPRFPPVREEEVDALDIEISVLSPLKRVEDVSEITVGRHGIYIIRGVNRGVLLPQVATQYGWDRETFLEQTCMKAGIPEMSWKRSDTEIYTFTAEIFGEKEPRGDQV